MIKYHEVIYSLYSEIVHIIDSEGKAYDKDWNEVQFDAATVEAKAAELQAEKDAIAQIKVDAKQSALNKLMALGLTEEEALALGK